MQTLRSDREGERLSQWKKDYRCSCVIAGGRFYFRWLPLWPLRLLIWQRRQKCFTRPPNKTMLFPSGMKRYNLFIAAWLTERWSPQIMTHRFIFGDWRVKLTISSLPWEKKRPARSTISCFIRTSRALSHIRAVWPSWYRKDRDRFLSNCLHESTPFFGWM